MRRRFGRRRHSQEQGAREAAAALSAVAASGVVAVEGLTPVDQLEVPHQLAAVGVGEEAGSAPVVVAISPRSGSAALLAGLAVGARLAAESAFGGRVLAISPDWPQASRVLLGGCGELPFRVRALVAGAPESGSGSPESAPGSERSEPSQVQADSGESPALLTTPLALMPSPPASSAGEEFWPRASTVLQGLASKHGGVVQRDARGLRLVLLGETVALLRPEEIELWLPRRETLSLAARSLDEAFDWLEGSIRKVLSNKKLLEGEMGLRSRGAPALAAALGLRPWTRWPLATGLSCPLDLLGVDNAGRPVGGALRRELNLPDLLPILEAAALLAPRLPQLLPLGAALPEAAHLFPIAVAAETWSDPVRRVLAALVPAPRGFRFSDRDPGAESFAPVELLHWSAPDAGSGSGAGAGDASTAEPVARATGPGAPAGQAAASASRVGDAPAPAGSPTPGGEGERAGRVPPAPARRFEELSVFDLDNEGSVRGEGGGGERRRRRRGGRGRGEGEERPPRGAAGAARGEAERGAADSDGGQVGREPAPRTGRRRRRRSRERPLMVEEVAQEDPEEDEESPAADSSEGEGRVGGFAEAPGENDDDEPDLESLQTDPDAALLGTIAKVPEVEEEAERPSLRIAPRRRAAIAAHADRHSLGAAVLLARELRLVEGIWVYPQSDLMTFFRSVATDLREGMPIYSIGFTASPARETLQAAALYRGRLIWFDHHEWPPEDLEGLRAAIGADAVHVEPGSGNCVSLIAALCTRRSRFSDKLLDLLSCRFSISDFESWGRYWWWRLGELAEQPGERRRDLQNLLAGRGSEFAQREVASSPPPLPPELSYVAGRDFPLVHFGGYTLVSVSVPPHLDALLAARIARERYGAQLALARCEGEGWIALTGDDASGRHTLDLGALADHLAAKFGWVTRWPSHDYVVRVRVADLAARPGRVDEIVSEIAMGRSVLER